MWTKNEKALMAVALAQLQQKGYSKQQMYADISGICGFDVTSRADKRLQHQHFKAMLKHLKALGFKHITHEYDNNDMNNRSGSWANKVQLDKIYEMWRLTTKHPGNWSATLDAFLEKRFQIKDKNWIKKNDAKKIIEAIKKMYLRKALLEAFGALCKDKEMTGNKLLELFSLLKGGFTRNEIAFILTIEVARADDLRDGMKVSSQISKKYKLNKLIGE